MVLQNVVLGSGFLHFHRRYSSVGRALKWHSRGHGFESNYLYLSEVSNIVNLRNEITKAIGIIAPNTIPHVEYRLLDSTKADGYTRQLIEYDSYGDKVIAFLLLPEILDKNPAILINHQHNREHHLGKSEVCGLAGNPLQAFGPALVKKGFVVLAPDSICFEERLDRLQLTRQKF